MPSTDELRAQLKVAELEEELAAAKDDESVTAELKHELRYARWVQRGGPAEEAAAVAANGHTNRAVADLYQRWLAETAPTKKKG
jgi:hypothetical protein